MSRCISNLSTSEQSCIVFFYFAFPWMDDCTSSFWGFSKHNQFLIWTHGICHVFYERAKRWKIMVLAIQRAEWKGGALEWASEDSLSFSSSGCVLSVVCNSKFPSCLSFPSFPVPSEETVPGHMKALLWIESKELHKTRSKSERLEWNTTNALIL